LEILDKEQTVSDSLDLAKSLNVAHTELDKILKSLISEDYVVCTVLEKKLIELSKEGLGYTQNGTPEFQYANSLAVNQPTPKSEVEKLVGKDIAKIGFSKAMSKKWISLDPQSKENVVRLAETLDDSEKQQLLVFIEKP
jgi:hypothetical protein